MNVGHLLTSIRGRWFQFGVRSLFLWTTIAGGSIGVYTQCARRQAIAVRAIVVRGGIVRYDEPERDGSAPCEKWRDWLEQSLGKDFAYRVTALDLDTNCDDALLSYVGRLRDVETIYFFHGAPLLTDAGVRRLTGLARLKTLDAPASRVTDCSLYSLAALPSLVEINLNDAHISDAGLTCLQKRRNLESLDCAHSPRITDAGMLSIGSHHQLRGLNVCGTSITSEGLKHLRNLKQLESLDLSDNPAIGDGGMAWLSEMSALNGLYLRNTSITSKAFDCLKRLRALSTLDLSDNPGITDDGVECLSRLRNLKTLKLRNTGITSEGIRRLRSLAKVARLDISENHAIDEETLHHLGDLTTLEWLDLHNTEVMRRGEVATESIGHLGRIRKLRFLDISGTGVDVTRVEKALRATHVIGSRASFNVRPGMAHCAILEYEAYKLADAKPDCAAPFSFDAAPHSLRTYMLRGALDRMLALCKTEGIAATFADQRPFVQSVRQSCDAIGYRAEDGRAALFSHLLAAMRRNNWLKRLYSAGSDLQLADAMQAHLEFLERVRREWSLTDVELRECSEARQGVRVFLRDAALNLGLTTDWESERPTEEVLAIWRQIRVAPKEPAKISCWERSSGF